MAEDPRSIGIAGAGVIGGGWVARWVSAGAHVKVFDPAPDAEQGIERLLGNARRALAELHGELPLGTWEMVDSVAEAAAGAELFHENVPERLDLKVRVLAEIDAALDPAALLCSSTSGLRPTLLQAEMAHPERLVVAHPFNPVYLLPLVEICGGHKTAAASVQRACEVFKELGMRPLVVRQEIDGFIADRLLEALWREALWLINDGVATTEEVDDAIRFGPGLRWAAMGTMLTYRIAGGRAGMEHFLQQFGPALKWPWSHLTNTPEMDADLIGRIVEQSDDQAAGASLDELERVRDDSLVSVLKGLRSVPYGAGETLRDHDERLAAARSNAAAAEPPSEL